MNAITLRNRGQRFAGSAALDRLGSLVVAQLALAAEFDAGGHSTLATFDSPLTFSGKIVPAPAALSASIWPVRFWSRVETLA